MPAAAAGEMLWVRLRLLKSALRLVLHKGALYGSYAVAAEVHEAGNQCPICQVRTSVVGTSAERTACACLLSRARGRGGEGMRGLASAD